MAIGIDVQIDPSGAVSGGRTATTSLDKIENSADGATQGTRRLRDEMTTMSAASLAASKNQITYQKSLQGSTAATRQLTSATDSAGNSMAGFRGFVGQAGFQISDIAIQLQSGANAAAVFGIQGGQLLGVVSPLAGALATVAGILVSQFTGGMYASAEATRELDSALTLTNEEINELTESQARLASAKLEESLIKDYQALEETRARVATLTVEVDKYNSRVDEVSESQLFGKGALLAAEEFYQSIVNQVQALTDAEGAQENLELKIQATLDTLAKYGVVLEGNNLKEEDGARAAERRADAILSLSQNIAVLQLELEGSNREATIQDALFRTGAVAGSEYAKQIELLVGQQFDLRQQLQNTDEAIEQIDKDGAYLAKLERQIELVSLSARQQAVLRAEYSLSADATDEQIAKARELADALFEARQAQKPADTSDADFESSVTGTSVAIATENLTVLEELENQRALILEYQDLEIGDAKAHADALVAIDRQSNVERANIAASGFGSLLSLQQAYGSESSSIYKTLLIAQKTATSASVLLSSYDAIGKAWASAPFPANLGPVAVATVETGALSGLVEAVSPSFATGGLAFGPGTGTSDSFTANLSNGEFVMPQRETARNLGTLQSMRAGNDVTSGGDVKVNVVNQTTGRVDNASANWVSRDELTVILSEEVPGLVAAEFNDEYSQTNKSVQQNYVLQRSL